MDKKLITFGPILEKTLELALLKCALGELALILLTFVRILEEMVSY